MKSLKMQISKCWSSHVRQHLCLAKKRLLWGPTVPFIAMASPQWNVRRKTLDVCSASAGRNQAGVAMDKPILSQHLQAQIASSWRQGFNSRHGCVPLEREERCMVANHGDPWRSMAKYVVGWLVIHHDSRWMQWTTYSSCFLNQTVEQNQIFVKLRGSLC